MLNLTSNSFRVDKILCAVFLFLSPIFLCPSLATLSALISRMKVYMVIETWWWRPWDTRYSDQSHQRNTGAQHSRPAL